VPFTNPDATFAEQAARVQKLYQYTADVRDKDWPGESDARRVNLNNFMMAANAAMATLRILHWAKQGGESVLIQALGLERPEYITPVAEDLLRANRLFLLIEGQFQIETLFRNILTALGNSGSKQGFFNVATDVVKATKIPDPEQKVRTLNVAALMRNSMHANGIHYGWRGSDTVETLGDVEFRFEHGKRVQCGSWLHIVTALTASMAVVDEVLTSKALRAVGAIPDVYAVQKATEATSP
jgi:hypothetical protein